MALRKHLSLVYPYVRLSFMKWREYKFNVVTNTVSYVLFLGMWILFWNVLLSNVKEIGEWTFPMAILLTGFVMVSETVWQLVWASIKLYQDIPSGMLDIYLVRPIQPVFAMIMSEVQFFSLIPIGIGISLIVTTMIKYYSFDIIRLFFALLITICGSAVLSICYMIIGCFSFWLGRTDSVRSFYRSFLFSKNYPATLFPYPVEFFLTFVVPISLFGTLPVLVLTKFDIKLGALTAFGAVLIVIFWSLVLRWLWKAGLKRYESQGG